jgi:tocopherol O-methyltransferase
MLLNSQRQGHELTIQSASDVAPLKHRIAHHYDELSPLYRDLWGIHIHHGYWKAGNETKEEAQEQLIVELATRAQVEPGSRILDVGCGMGGSAIALSCNFGASVVGVTISSAQVAIGNDLAHSAGADVELLHMDAEALELAEPFDVVWSVEAISHLNNKIACFRSMAKVLKQGGKVIVADWFKAPDATRDQEREFIVPIERTMLVPKLERVASYVGWMRQEGLNVTHVADFSAKVSKTWDIAIGLIGNPALWKFAATRGQDFLAFLEGFSAMRAGYRSKTLVYGVIVAEKP